MADMDRPTCPRCGAGGAARYRPECVSGTCSPLSRTMTVVADAVKGTRTTTWDDVTPPETLGVPGAALQLLLDGYAALSVGTTPTPEQSAAWDAAYDTLGGLVRCT